MLLYQDDGETKEQENFYQKDGKKLKKIFFYDKNGKIKQKHVFRKNGTKCEVKGRTDSQFKSIYFESNGKNQCTKKSKSCGC